MYKWHEVHIDKKPAKRPLWTWVDTVIILVLLAIVGAIKWLS